MNKINILSSKIYNRISAGEVVERPSCAVKELVENSIDAGAKNIIVDILDGGKSKITVIDDGFGIYKSQLKKAVLPHATSKISAVSDLDNISTLGFRGEALASIGAVSKLKITSKPVEQEMGACICVNGGEINSVLDVACANGTEIEVANLFYNTPAREKFLKTDKGEEGQITSLMAKFILSNHNIAFKYSVDGRVIYQSFGDGLKSAMCCVYGAKILDDCFYISNQKHGIIIEGYIGKHYFSKPNRSYQSAFLNGRSVNNQTITVAITNAYSSYLMKRQYPFFVISISMPYENVDVNVHPNKTDVRFSDNRVVYSALYSSICNVLDGSSEALNILVDENSNNNAKSSENSTIYDKHNDIKNLNKDKLVFEDSVKDGINHSSKQYSVSLELKKRSATQTLFNSDNLGKDIIDVFAENKAYIEKLEKEREERLKQNQINDIISMDIKRSLVYVGQVLNTYLILEDGKDVYFIDQHAAHERLLFDKYKKQYSSFVETQPLLLPYILNVNNAEFLFLSEKLPILNNLGIEISEFGENSYKISALPVFLSQMNIAKFFNEVLSDLDSLKNLTVEDLLKEKIAQKACKSAIKAGDKLDRSDIDALLKALNFDLGLKCPHGRPIAIKIMQTEIEKWFKRIV